VAPPRCCFGRCTWLGFSIGALCGRDDGFSVPSAGLFSFYADRVAFAVLVFFVALRAMALGEKVPFLPD